jgi:hypothetical protein
MNLRRGLVRLWLISSATWVAFWLWRADIPCMLGHTSAGERPWCTDPLDYPETVLANDTMLVISVPVLISFSWDGADMDRARLSRSLIKLGLRPLKV